MLGNMKIIIYVPNVNSIEEAIDFLKGQNCGPEFYLYRGPDGLVRGYGVKLQDSPVSG